MTDQSALPVARRRRGCIPSSIATWVSRRPLDASSDTASRLNSSVNDRGVVVFVVINATRPVRSLHEAHTHSGEGQEDDMTYRK